MASKFDIIASLVHQEFDKLPAKRKPVVRDNGLREWVPLSGIVAEGRDGKLTCLSLATGMKCLPASKVPHVQGNVLHDWHAEVLAIRAFNCFVLDECRRLAASGITGSSEFLHRRSSAEVAAVITPTGSGNSDWHSQPFAWREDVLLYMYCSEAPCGDASMELTMASQEDATPWLMQPQVSEPTDQDPASNNTSLPGRAYFSELGIVRRKPSRGDAPPTLSKSCSDKLSLRQCTSLLSSVNSLLVHPRNAYINTLIMPVSQYSATACRRAFSDGKCKDTDIEDDPIQQQPPRMAPLTAETSNRDQQTSGYIFRPFTVETTSLEFAFSRRSTLPSPTESTANSHHHHGGSSNPEVKLTPSNLAVALTALGREEGTLNGVLQGRKASDAHPRGASFTSRRRMWELAVDVARALKFGGDDCDNDNNNHDNSTFVNKGDDDPSDNIRQIQNALGAISPASSLTIDKEVKVTTYGGIKESTLLIPRRHAKEVARRLALKGWVRNVGDEDFVL